MKNNLSSTLTSQAFLKFSSQVYFDKQNLHLREKLARFIDAGKIETLDELHSKINAYDDSIKKMIANEVKVTLLPKSVKENSTIIDASFLKTSFYTNQVYKAPALVDKVTAFIDIPIELHIIDVMWIIKYGHFLEKELDKCCVGNRLVLNKKLDLQVGRTLFKKYEKQYQKWWSNGIKEAKDLFDKKENVTILNFDIKNYYHSIRFNFTELEEFLIKKDRNITTDPLHKIFVEIHKAYADKLNNVVNCLGLEEAGKYPLPIGLYSSCVLSNWYLKEFDSQIKEQVNPIYYARYVDDLMVVIKDTLVEEFKKTEETANDKHALVCYYIDKYFGNLFALINNEEKNTYHILDNDTACFKFTHDKFKHLCLQSEKFFIYQFNAEFSPHLLNKFQDEQRERLSAFQFLSEEDDDSYRNLDEITFENNFDEKDVNNAKFKNVDDNKYKIAVYLSKLIQGSVLCGSEFNVEEAEKVKKFFKGFYLIKNYYFWEKLFTLSIVRKDYTFLFSLYGQIKEQIDTLELGLKETKSISIEPIECIKRVKDSLYQYLEYAFKMACGLYPGVVQERAFMFSKYKDQIREIDNLSIYRKTWLLRKAGIVYPLLQFTNAAQQNNFPLYDREQIRSLTGAHTNKESRKILFEIDADAFFPYRIKFYECCLIAFKCTVHEHNETVDLNQKREVRPYIDAELYLDKAFEIFYFKNYISFYNSNPETVKEEYYQICNLNKEDIYNNKIEYTYNQSVHINNIKTPNSKEGHGLRTCVVNKFVNSSNYVAALEGTPIESPERLEDFNRILDSIKRVNGADFFIMPELALPFSFVPHFSQYSVQNQIGFNTGIEFLKIGNLGFNFLMTSLPVKVAGDKDAVLLFRLKNHYAHAEEKLIEDKLMVVPKPKKYYYDLIQWRGAYFTSYYCFEIADLQHRSSVYGLADILFVPVWNRDMHYYNNLTESASRDMHCFVVMCNTSQYGDSRIIAPLDHINKDILRVKGGTVKEHKSTTLVGDLDLANLRDFQNHAYAYIESFNAEHKTHFKPLPPDYPYVFAQLRKAKKLFVKRKHTSLVDEVNIEKLIDALDPSVITENHKIE